MGRNRYRSHASGVTSPRRRVWTCCFTLTIFAMAVMDDVPTPTIRSEFAQPLALQRVALSSQQVSDDLRARARRPNVLIFLTDDQRAGPTRVMRATRRFIGRKGVTFTNAHVTTPLCCPSRASIMTGRYAHNHHVRRNPSRRNLNMSTTLQHNLHEAGYRTAVVGKFLNRWNPTRVPPDFDQSALLIPFALGSNPYYGTFFSINGRVRKVKRYSTDFIGFRTAKILQRFNRRDERPWMMYVNPYAPHDRAVPHGDTPACAWRE